MAVQFIYRSAYETPLGRRIVHYPDEHLLAWFQRHWVTEKDLPGDRESCEWEERAYQRTVDVFQGSVYGFSFVWRAMLERGRPPSSGRGLAKWLNNLQDYPEGEIYAQSHAFQATTDDDELDLALMMFDDEFAARHPDRIEYVAREQLELPEDVHDDAKRFVWRGRVNDLKPVRRGPGAVFLILIVIHDTGWLTDMYGGFRFRGIRLPEFVEFLQTARPGLSDPDDQRWIARGEWPDELRLLRWAALQQPSGASLEDVLRAADAMHPHDRVRHFFPIHDAYKKYSRRTFLLEDRETCEAQMRLVDKRIEKEKQKQNERPSRWRSQRLPTYIQMAPHVAQLGFTEHSKFEGDESFGHDTNTHWLCFDDLWAASHPDLAKSLLWYAATDTPLF